MCEKIEKKNWKGREKWTKKIELNCRRVEERIKKERGRDSKKE